MLLYGSNCQVIAPVILNCIAFIHLFVNLISYLQHNNSIFKFLEVCLRYLPVCNIVFNFGV